MLEHPVFSIQYTISGTGVEIRLNDIPVISTDSKSTTISEKKVPESIIDGKNTIMIRTFPLEEHGNKHNTDASVDATLVIHEKDTPVSKGQPLLHLRLNPANSENNLMDGSNAEYGEAPLVFSHSNTQSIAGRQVTIQSPFPRWAWQDGQIIENTAENYASLLEKHKEIWAVLEQENKEKIFSIYAPAAKEFATAYHYENIESGHRLMDTGNFFGKQDWQLGDITQVLETGEYHLLIHANGLMAKIIDKYHKSPIVYLNPESELLSFQKFGFYKNKNGEWVMIR